MKTLNQFIEAELEQDYMKSIQSHLEARKKAGINIYPPEELRFNAFNKCNEIEKIKIVIIGQDPYHAPGQAMGLSFSVPKGTKIPSSLKNIFKEIKSDTGLNIQTDGDLTNWADQGVFLLNSSLTVEEANANSHQKIGWDILTDKTIKFISDNTQNVVFMLWGNFAKKKKEHIDKSKHLILEAAHPSGLSANRGFFGCKHFTKANTYLYQNKKKYIQWG